MNPNVRSIDGVSQSRPMSVAPSIRTPKLRPVQNHAAGTRKKFATQSPPKERRVPEWIQLPLIIAGGMLAGLAIQSPVLGQAVLVVYGIVAFFLRIPSRITFVLALLAMVATTVLLVFKGDIFMAQNFATYTFLLLVVGVITLNRELKKEGGRIYYNRRTR